MEESQLANPLPVYAPSLAKARVHAAKLQIALKGLASHPTRDGYCNNQLCRAIMDLEDALEKFENANGPTFGGK